jgi:putative transcription regulator
VQDLYGYNPMMKVIPVEWEHVMPVGILYSPEPTEVVDRFLTVTKEVLHSKKDRL